MAIFNVTSADTSIAWLSSFFDATLLDRSGMTPFDTTGQVQLEDAQEGDTINFTFLCTGSIRRIYFDWHTKPNYFI